MLPHKCLSWIIPSQLRPRSQAPIGWTNQSDAVTIQAGADAHSGVAKTEYRLGTSGNWMAWQELGADGQLNIQEEGELSVQAKTIDRAGNESDVVTAIVKIDRTPPTVSFVPSGNLVVSKEIETAVTVTDEASGF